MDAYIMQPKADVSACLSAQVLALCPSALMAAYTDAELKTHKSHETYGLALFYHVALRDANAAECWSYLYAHFDRMVGGWITRVVRDLTLDEIRDLSHDALTRFWERFGLKQFANANGQLSSVLGLLRAMTENMAKDMLRNQRRHEVYALPDGDSNHITVSGIGDAGVQSEQTLTLPHDQTPEDRVLSTMTVDAVWACIAEACTSEREWVVAEESWDQERTPRDIAAAYPSLFKSAQEVSTIRHTLLRRLRQHPRVIQLSAAWC